MIVHGTTEKSFEPVREAFVSAQANDPGGAQLCIYRHGEIVVDLWTGRDIANDRPYTELQRAMAFTKLGPFWVRGAQSDSLRRRRCSLHRTARALIQESTE